MTRLPEIGSRWQDKETRDIALVERVEMGADVFGKRCNMVTMRYTEIHQPSPPPAMVVLPIEMFEHFWKPFPSCWDKLREDAEWLG